MADPGLKMHICLGLFRDADLVHQWVFTAAGLYMRDHLEINSSTLVFELKESSVAH